MSKDKPFQSQSINGSHLSGSQVQMGQAEGGNVTQIQQGNQANVAEATTTDELMKSLELVEQLLRTARLPDTVKEEAIAYLTTAKREVKQAEPDKELVAKTLKRMGETVKTADDTVKAGKGLWETIKPILVPLIGWLGTAKSLLGI